MAPRLLACPACHALLHAAEIKRLVAEGEAASGASTALHAFRRAQELLPPGSLQYRTLAGRIEALSRQVDAAPGPVHHPGRGKLAGVGAAAGATALLLWKLKSVVLLVATKGKLILLGLGKSSTFFSMALSFGVYWQVFGWPLAAGLVLSIYVHEMGHVLAMRHLGIAATAPMFIPGFGAYVRGRQYPANARENARVGLAGPIYGLGAAVACYALYLATEVPVLAAIARFGAFINLFNLLPVLGLDGAHGMRALSRAQRVAIAVLSMAAFAVSREGLLPLIAILSVVQAMTPGAEEPDGKAFAHFALLVAALTAMLLLPVPGLPTRS